MYKINLIHPKTKNKKKLHLTDCIFDFFFNILSFGAWNKFLENYETNYWEEKKREWEIRKNKEFSDKYCNF